MEEILGSWPGNVHQSFFLEFLIKRSLIPAETSNIWINLGFWKTAYLPLPCLKWELSDNDGLREG